MNYKQNIHVLALLACLALAPQVVSQELFSAGLSGSADAPSGRAGFIDVEGRVAIGFNYYATLDFSEGLAAVLPERDGKWGYINKRGKMVIQAAFDEAGPFNGGVAAVRRGKQFFLIKQNGTMIGTAMEGKIFRSSEGLAMFVDSRGRGFVGIDGSVLIEPRNVYFGEFSEGYATFAKDGKMGFMDKTGKVIIERTFFFPYYAWIVKSRFSEGLAPAFESKEKCGFIGRDGKWVIPPRFKWAEPFSEGLAAVQIGDKYGFIDKSGKIVIEAAFELAFGFRDGFAPVRSRGKMGMIDRKGEFAIPAGFDWLGGFENGLARFENRDATSRTVGYVNRVGKIVYSW